MLSVDLCVSVVSPRITSRFEMAAGRSSPKRTFASLWNYAIAAGAAVVLAVRGVNHNYPKLVIFLFFAVALGSLAYGAVRYFKSARAAIILENSPTLGQPLRGRVLSGLDFVPEEAKITMRCIHEWTDFDGAGSAISLFSGHRRRRYSRRMKETVWEESTAVPRQSLRGSPSGFSVPFEFTLPSGGHRSGYVSDDLYRWEIETYADIPGVDFHCVFAVKI